MQPSHPTRHLKRVCYAELGGPRVSLPVGVGPAFQATVLSDVGLSEGDRGDQPYDLALELSRAPRWRPPGHTVLVETDLVHVAPAPLHVDASGAWDGSQGSFASVYLEKGTASAFTRATLSESCRPTSCQQQQSLTRWMHCSREGAPSTSSSTAIRGMRMAA